MTQAPLPPRFTLVRALSDGARAARLVRDGAANGELRVLRPLAPTVRAGAQLLVGVAHANLAAIVEIVVTDAGAYTLSEYAEGETLAVALPRLAREQRVEVVLAILAALEPLHARGLAHGDVAPSNVIVGADGSVRLIDPIVPGDAAAPLGTLQMLAHERLLGAPPAAAADLFAVGAIAYEAITNRAAFAGATAIDVVRALVAGPAPLAAGEALAPFVLASLAREVAHRPQHASEARAMLLRALGRLEAPTAQDAAFALDHARAAPTATCQARLVEFLETGATLVIAGGPGSGKTLVLDALADLAHARGQMAVVVRGGEPGAVAAARTRLAHLLGLASGVDPIAVAAAAHALVVCVDDFDRAAPEVRAFVAEALALPEAQRPSIAVTGDQDECVLRLPRGARVDVYALDVLTDRDVARFVKIALPEVLAPEALAVDVVRRTRGHPAATRALLSRFALSHGFLRSGSAWLADLDRLHAVEFDAAAGVGHELAVAKLAEPARSLLALVAAASCPLPLGDAAVVLRVDAQTLLAAALELSARRLVRHDGGVPPTLELRFPHDRAGLLDALLPGADRMRRLAAQLVRGVRSNVRLQAAANLAVECRSHNAGALLRKAARAHMDAKQPGAALEAMQRFVALAPAKAEKDRWTARLTGRAWAALGSAAEADKALGVAIARTRGPAALQLVLERAQVLDRASRPVDALAAVDEGLRRDDLGDARALRALRAWLLFATGLKDDARAAVDALVAIEAKRFEPTPQSLEVFATAMAVYHRCGDARRARAAAVAGRRVASGIKRFGRAAHFDSTLGAWDLEAGRIVRGTRRVRRALELLERVDDRRLLPDTLMRFGWLQIRIGDTRAALEAFRRAELMFEKVGNQRGLGWAHNGLGAALLSLGDPDGAAQAFERSLAEREAVGAHPGAGLAAVNLYRAHVARLDLEAARRAAHKALHLARGAGRGEVRAAFLLAVCQTAARERDARRLRVLSRRALAAAEATGLDEEIARAAGLCAEAALPRGDWAGGLALARRLHRSARKRSHRGDLAYAGVLRAGLLLLRGRGGEARRLFAQAQGQADTPVASLDALLLHARLALLAFTRGDGSEARGGRLAAQEAERAAERLADRHVADAARRLVAALLAAEESSGPGADAHRQNRKLKQVLEATRWINEATAVRDVLSRIIDAAIELSNARRGFVVVREDDNAPLAFVAARSLKREDILDPALQVSRSIVAEVLATGRTVVTSEARVDERFRDVRSISELALLSVVCAPLKSRGVVVGAIYVDDPTRVDRFDEHAREHLEALAEHAAIALDKARLLNHIEELRRDLEHDVAARDEELLAVRSDLERVNLDLEARYATRHLVTNDPRVLELLDLVARIADTDASVLVQGEPGTGKEMIARALHFSSHRRRRRFVAVNCAALPEGLVESELFGYKRGAFSGAVADRDGLVAVADGGTLFLDEIGEMPLAIQAKLLRVVQDGEYLPLGATKPRRSRLRVVSASNRPLKDMVEDGRFRQDLFYRLRVIQLDVPPLRERRGDIPLLVRSFAARAATESGHPPKQFTDAAIEALSQAHWPGNVRELEGLVHALVATTAADTIDVGQLPQESLSRDEIAEAPRSKPADSAAAGTAAAGSGAEGTDTTPGEPVSSLKAALDRRERELVADALAKRDGHRAAAAADLGITTRWLAKLIQKYGL